MSLIEMLATLLIMGFVTAAITEIAVTQNVVAFRTSNKLDALINARRVASFVERDIHNAKFIGNALSNTPDNFNGYSLDPQTLIVQIPVFYAPTNVGGIPGVPTKSSTPSNHWNVDTIIYQVVGDPARPGTGQFMLQRTVYLGDHLAGYDQGPAFLSETLLTGIVGPIDLSAPTDPVALTPLPKVFGFLSKSIPLYSQSPQYSPELQPAANDINGVSMNLEIFSDQASKRTDLAPRSMAFRTEMYMRGNFASPMNF